MKSVDWLAVVKAVKLVDLMELPKAVLMVVMKVYFAVGEWDLKMAGK